MRRILDESPDLTFEQAKQLAKTQLLKAAGRKNYKITTPKQDRERVERLKLRSDATPESGKNTHPSEVGDKSDTSNIFVQQYLSAAN